MKKMSLVCIGVLLMAFAGCTVFSNKKGGSMNEYTKDLSTVIALFPTSVQEIEQLKQEAMQQAQADVAAILAVPEHERTFFNTFGAYDRASSHYGVSSTRIASLQHVNPDAALREAAQATCIEMSAFSLDLFGYNVDLYKALKSFAEGNAKKEQLSSTQWYFIREVLDGFKRAGLELPAAKQEQVKALKKELSTLTIEFEKNIAESADFITVSKDELEGLDDDFIEALEKTEEGTYKLGTDYPTYLPVMEFCTVAATRKQMFELFTNRAYPQNKHVLEQIIAKRDALARLLGYQSYAELSLDDEMVKTPERAQAFIDSLLPKAQEKERQEFATRIKDLPPSVTLTEDGKMQPWDGAFVSAYYKKKYYNLDERLVAEYFPMERAIKGLFNIYQSFFAIKMVHEPVSGLWHPDVSLIKIYRKADNQLLGYIFLDLHPRPNKFCHAGHLGVVPATKNADGTINSAVSLVMANFPKSTEKKPSLLKRSDVSTFFHEFGHGIHAVLGATEIIGFSGTDVKTDFVELPSQMLEYWLYDRDILKMLSKHYKTGQQLPDDVIDAIIGLKNFNAGATTTRQLMIAKFALELFGPGEQKDIDALYQKLWQEALLFSRFDNDNHFYAAFGHLTNYGARYYGYMWSKVFAADLFYHIKPHGLVNHEIGMVYAEKILAPGGSVDPNELLKDFLGREPNQGAFLKDLGL